MATAFTQDNFKSDVLESDKPVLVDFWAPWCGPCKMLGPVIDKLATDMADTVSIGKVNTDEAGDLAAEYGITSIPALLLFKNGEVVAKTAGFQPEPALRKFIEDNA